MLTGTTGNILLLAFTHWSLDSVLWALWELCFPINLMKMPAGGRSLLSRFTVSILKCTKKKDPSSAHFPALSQMKWPAGKSEPHPLSPPSPYTPRTHFDQHGERRGIPCIMLCLVIGIPYNFHWLHIKRPHRSLGFTRSLNYAFSVR